MHQESWILKSRALASRPQDPLTFSKLCGIKSSWALIKLLVLPQNSFQNFKISFVIFFATTQDTALESEVTDVEIQHFEIQ